MVLSDGGVVCEELDEGWSQVEEGGPVAQESSQEGGRLELGQRDQLPPAEQEVGHGQVHGEDVEERQDTDGDLLRGHEVHGGMVQLGHVGYQVPVTFLLYSYVVVPLYHCTIVPLYHCTNQ